MRTLLLFGLCLAAALPASAQRRAAGTTTFAVMVTGPDGAGLSGVRVTAVSGKTERSSTTEGGRTVFENVPNGTYHFTFERDGYDTVQQDVTGKRGGIVEVKAAMAATPKPEPPPQPSPAAEGAPEPAVKPVVLDMPAFIEKNYVGKAAGTKTAMACAPGGSATLVQINDPIAEHTHGDADEFIYVIAGQGDVLFGSRDEPLGAGVFVMVPRGTPHSFRLGKKKPLVFVSTLAGDQCGAQ
jgi:mannose-6-phosphate isomerase-like protein (cupin superfamily)